MYKSRLQELCHQKQWILPQYSTVKDGPNHMPCFATTVIVNGLSFETPQPSRSSKESQNEAAKVALDHLAGPPRAPTEPPVIAAQPTAPVPTQATVDLSGSLGGSDMLASLEQLQPKLPEEYPATRMKMDEEYPIIEATPSEGCCSPQANQSSTSVKDDAPVRDVWHLSKNQLQMYAQKRNLLLPTYSCEREGPPHASRFKCKVTIDGKTFEGPDYCNTLKDAEHAAARVALLTLSSNGDQERDSGLYKNLLQEFAQKEGYHLPVYETNGSFGNIPSFTSTVVIEGESFTGQQGRTKKQAEMDAARVAYTLLKERKRCQTSTSQSPAHQGPIVFSSSTSSQPHNTTCIQLNIGSTGNAVSNFTLLTKTEIVDTVTEYTESKNHHILSPSHESETSTLRSGDPLLSDTGYAEFRNPTLQDRTPEPSSPSENGNMLRAAADSTAESPGEAVTLPPRGVVRIYSRALNATLPEGSVVERSDDKWVAVIAGPDPNKL